MKIGKLRNKLKDSNWVIKKLKRERSKREHLADAYVILRYDENWVEIVHNPTFKRNERRIKFLEKIYLKNR